MLEGISSIYRPQFGLAILYLLRRSGYQITNFERSFWRTSNFNEVVPPRKLPLSVSEQLVLYMLWAGILLQVAVCSIAAAWGINNHTPGVFQISIALLLAAPLIWVQLLALSLGFYGLLAAVIKPKKTAKSIISRRLERQVGVLRKKNDFYVIAVVGSVGKTGTKLAVAKTLQAAGLRVCYQEGNYNDRVTVPLVFFGKELPALTNALAWRKLLKSNKAQLKNDYPYDVVVVELGTDGPGQINEFAYLKPDLGIVTSVAPEHIEYLGSLDEVAKEELSIANFANQLLINSDDVDKKYIKGLSYSSYGLKKPANYIATGVKRNGLKTQSAKLQLDTNSSINISTTLLGDQGLKVVIAAAASAHMLSIDTKLLPKALKTVTAFSGRMQVIKGVKDSYLIDDTYNSSPSSSIAALDVLYSTPAKQRIAILGSMNELGDYSEQAHREVGQYCDPNKLDLVITIGEQAERWLAHEAIEKGCKVASFKSPYEAGKYVKKNLKTGAVVLAKGSQNGVFAEEALKSLLAKSSDTKKLVRQSDYWMKIKKSQFS